MYDYYYHSFENGTGYTIDYGARRMETYYQGVLSEVPFNAAFARAVDCMMHVEDGRLPNTQQQLFLAVYKKYLDWAPRDLNHPSL